MSQSEKLFKQVFVDHSKNSARSASAVIELMEHPGVFIEVRLSTLPIGPLRVSSLYLVTESLSVPAEYVTRLNGVVDNCALTLPRVIISENFRAAVLDPFLKGMASIREAKKS